MLEADLGARTEERDAAREEATRLAADLAREGARLEKARVRWGEDRQALDAARQALCRRGGPD